MTPVLQFPRDSAEYVQGYLYAMSRAGQGWFRPGMAAPMWDTGFYSDWGGVAEMQRVCQCYRHERDFSVACTRFVEGWFLMPFFLCAGEVAAVCAVEEKRVGILKSIVEQVPGPLDGPGMDRVRETQWASFATTFSSPYQTVGLMAQADATRRVFGVHEFGGAWAAKSAATWGPKLLPHLDQSAVRTSFHLVVALTAAVCCEQPAKDSQAIGAELRGLAQGGISGGGVDNLAAAQRSSRMQFVDSIWNTIMPDAALLCERLLHDDALAERYALRFLQRGGCEAHCSTALALLGRIAARRSKRDDAVRRWREAAAVAMDARCHLLALQVGWQCGGEAGSAIAQAACAAMGRSEEVVRRELEAAGATMEFNVCGVVAGAVGGVR